MREGAQVATLTRGTDIMVLRFILQTEFYLFCRYYDPGFFTDERPHLKQICDSLQKITEGMTRYLMMSLPPRGGKSYTVSLWCGWMIGRGAENPSTSIMRNCYGQTLAEKFSYDVRAIVQSRKFLDVFPGISLKEDRARVDDWSIGGGAQSTYFCSGVGGPITGKGCRTAAILDDPIKNLEDGLSQTILEKTWLWYLSTHKARIESGCPEIHIATRWSRRDPIGMILESNEAGKWEKIVIPALVNGRSFCEGVKTTTEYLELKALIDEFIWESEYMQNPVEAIGLLYPADQLKRFKITELQEDLIDAVVGYTDTADEGADYLASLTVALSGKKAFLVDVVFTQDPVEVTESLVAQQIIDKAHNRHVVESNAGGKSFARNVRALINGKSRCNITWKATTKNKETRILMNSGQVKEFMHFRSDYVPGSMYDRFMRQLTSYVKMGTNQADDAPDAITGIAEQIFRPASMRLLDGRTN